MHLILVFVCGIVCVCFVRRDVQVKPNKRQRKKAYIYIYCKQRIFSTQFNIHGQWLFPVYAHLLHQLENDGEVREHVSDEHNSTLFAFITMTPETATYFEHFQLKEIRSNNNSSSTNSTNSNGP